jgi:hypothetical protein
VLEQPVAIGLVVDLRRRRLAEPVPDLRALAEEAVEQGQELRLLQRRDQLAEVVLEPLDGDLGADRQVLRLVLARRRLAQRRQLDLRSPALADLEGATEVDDDAGGGDRVELLRLLPADGLGAAAGVGDGEAKPGLFVSLEVFIAFS